MKRKKKNVGIIFVIAALVTMLTGCGALEAAREGRAENTDVSGTGISQVYDLSTDVTNSDEYIKAYETLMTYKTENYSGQSVAEFNALLEADYLKFSEAYGIVVTNIQQDDENYDFVMMTLSNSVSEIYYRDVEKSNVVGVFGCAKKLAQPVKPLPGEEKILDDNPLYNFYFFVDYYINYTIPDSSVLTVGERDTAVAAVRMGMQNYVDGLSENEILNGGVEKMFTDKATALSDKFSTGNIKLSCEITSIEIYNNGNEKIINVESLSSSSGTNALQAQSMQVEELISKEDYKKIQSLQFDGYEDMAVSDYQKRVWEMTDTAEYAEMLERILGNEVLYELKDTDRTAAFLFYVLEPLTAEKWKTRSYGGYTDSSFAYPKDNAVLEYDFALTILNADTLTVREYNDTRLKVIKEMTNVLSDRSVTELQSVNTSVMEDDIQEATDNIIKSLQNEKIGISIEYAYFPIDEAGVDRGRDSGSSANREQRRYPNGTEEDYRSLLTLKSTDYRNMTLEDFNAKVLEWMDEDYERMERIGEDTACNDFRVYLSDEERSFIKLTVYLSGMENGKMIQSKITGRQEENPCCSEELPQKIADENSYSENSCNESGYNVAWSGLYYQFCYSISDKKTVTVGERDRQIQDMINAVRKFWNDMDIERVLKMNESDIVSELKKIAEKYSTDNITITISEEPVQFESMDERGL